MWRVLSSEPVPTKVEPAAATRDLACSCASGDDSGLTVLAARRYTALLLQSTRYRPPPDILSTPQRRVFRDQTRSSSTRSVTCATRRRWPPRRRHSCGLRVDRGRLGPATRRPGERSGVARPRPGHHHARTPRPKCQEIADAVGQLPGPRPEEVQGNAAAPSPNWMGRPNFKLGWRTGVGDRRRRDTAALQAERDAAAAEVVSLNAGQGDLVDAPSTGRGAGL